jgi:hypothetical protein
MEKKEEESVVISWMELSESFGEDYSGQMKGVLAGTKKEKKLDFAFGSLGARKSKSPKKKKNIGSVI